jgi:alpha-mannosidase
MRIRTVDSTDLFLGPTQAPRQVVRVTLAADGRGVAGPVRVRVEGPTVTTPVVETVTGLAPGEERVVEVGVRIAAPHSEGSVHRVTAVAECGPPHAAGPHASEPQATALRATAEGRIEAAATGWTMWMVSHFHYDPVWWNTQAGFTDKWHRLPDLPWVAEMRLPHVRTAFDLVRAHLEAARHDPDYRFVLAEADYLKPHWDVFPRDRADLRRFLKGDRVELVGGNYNEPNTNLTHPESTVRNAIHGIGLQRDVVGGDPRSAWMVDVFGHDPSYPGLMADAGLDSSAWARGPFHMHGPRTHTGDMTRMQFPSEFEWISPTGRGVLTHYMAGHYTAGWALERVSSAEESMARAYEQFSQLKQVAATRNVMLPVGHDHNVPSRWCTVVHREWAKRYVWPRFVVGLPREFFGAVRRELAGSGTSLSPQTRDMNPVYTGKDVSYIDTKQAQRAGEVAVLDAERLATLASLVGTDAAPRPRFPAEALDKAWRQLLYGAHHDAITGTESDQVYLDLLGGWREAFELGSAVRDAAVDHLAACVDTRGGGRAVLVVNPLSWTRNAIAEVRLTYPQPGTSGVAVRDAGGSPVTALAQGVRRHPDGTLAEVTLSFLARDLPSVGHRLYRVVDSAETPSGWTARTARTGLPYAENAAFRIEADPARGGALHRILDRRTGRELLRPGALGAELLVQDEHRDHPRWKEGPWHLLPKGPGRAAGESSAEVRVDEGPLGQRLVSTVRIGAVTLTQEAYLWHGVDRIDFRTLVDGSLGEERLLRVRFGLDLPGALPVAEVGYAAVGRSFGFPQSDASPHLWALDSPAHTWAGLSATARIALHGPDGTRQDHAIGVAEVVAPEGGAHAGEVRSLLVRLAGQGVTATCTTPGGRRYGSLEVDSNLPDVRIVLGADNAFAEAVLDAVEPHRRWAYRGELARAGRVFVPAAASRREAWVPDADLCGPRDLPVLIVSGPEGELAEAIGALAADLADGVIDVPLPAGLPGTAEPVEDYSVALLNRGTPGFVAETDGTLYLNLMRAHTGWPSGVWLDGPRSTVPDGSSFSQQHWTHTFDYSLVAGPGDWRQAGFVRAGQEFNHSPVARETGAHDGILPPRASLLTVEPAQVVLAALKPRGNPRAPGLPDACDPADGVALRLYESSGRPAAARVRLHGGLVDPARTDLLEERAVPGAPTELDGEVTLSLAPADVATLTGLPVLASLLNTETGREPWREPVEPVFTRYWMHNKGPAPSGNLPVTVHVSPTALRLSDDGGSAALQITVSCSVLPASGTVALDVPDGLAVEPHDGLDYDLAPGGFAEFEVSVRADGGDPGTYYLGARIPDHLGQLLEDTVAVELGAAETGTDQDFVPVLGELGPQGLALPPGGEGDLVLRLIGTAVGEVRGEAQLISPYGTWGDTADLTVTPWTRPFTVPAGGTAELRFPVRAAATARPGNRSWALVKLACHGSVRYTRAVPVEVADHP